MAKKKEDKRPFLINYNDKLFVSKIKKIVAGIREDNKDKIQEIKEYFAKYDIKVSYNKTADKVRLVDGGAQPVDFIAKDYE